MNQTTVEILYDSAVKGLTEGMLLDEKKWYNCVVALPLSEQIVYTVGVLNWQVENGGFHQYFFNGYGQFVFLTLKNLKVLGASDHYSLLHSAVKLINEDSLDESSFRSIIFNRRHKKIVEFEKELFGKLNDLDTRYYKMQEKEGHHIIDVLEKIFSENISRPPVLINFTTSLKLINMELLIPGFGLFFWNALAFLFLIGIIYWVVRLIRWLKKQGV